MALTKASFKELHRCARCNVEGSHTRYYEVLGKPKKYYCSEKCLIEDLKKNGQKI